MAPEKDCCDFCRRKLTPQDFEKGRALLRCPWVPLDPQGQDDPSVS